MKLRFYDDRRVQNRSREGAHVVNVYLDNSIVNNLLDLEESRPDPVWEENRKYLTKLRDGPVANGDMSFFVNPTVMSQGEATRDPQRREALINITKQFKFTKFNMTVFPFSFPAQFLSIQQKDEIRRLCVKYPKLARDRKILADSAFNDFIDVLLTTDDDLPKKVPRLGRVEVMLPKRLYQHWESHR